MRGGGYLFSNESPQSGPRFDALASLFDRWTISHLERLSVGEGWRVLEVGAGGGSVAAWLANRVGPSGHVVATDLDVRWLEERLRAPNVEVRRHDAAVDPLPDGEFDLVHERLVLLHIPEREEVLRKLAASLRPGGWLLSEAYDADALANAWMDPDGAPDEVRARVIEGIKTLLRQRGADTGLGLRLPTLLRDAGLVDLAADAYQVIGGGDGTRALLRANVLQTGEELVEQGLASREDLDSLLARVDEVTVDPTTPLLVSAWGRRPDA